MNSYGSIVLNHFIAKSTFVFSSKDNYFEIFSSQFFNLLCQSYQYFCESFPIRIFIRKFSVHSGATKWYKSHPSLIEKYAIWSADRPLGLLPGVQFVFSNQSWVIIGNLIDWKCVWSVSADSLPFMGPKMLEKVETKVLIYEICVCLLCWIQYHVMLHMPSF